MPVKNNNFIIALDNGGTFLKWTLVSLSGRCSPLSKKYFNKIKINSQDSADAILGVFISAIAMAFETADSLKLNIKGVGVSTPGPFDFENGISLMKHKFAAIYGVDLRTEIITHLNLNTDFPVRFMADSAAFLTGEAYFGAARNYNRIIGITLGTGIGSAFMIDKKIIEEDEGLPPEGGFYLFRAPYAGGVVEDKISKKAIISRYKQLGGKCSKDADVDKIDRLAAGGDVNAIEVFREFGANLGRILKTITSDFKPECIVLGGGISKGFYIFGESLKMELKSMPSLEKITTSKLGDLSLLYGVASLFQ